MHVINILSQSFDMPEYMYILLVTQKPKDNKEKTMQHSIYLNYKCTHLCMYTHLHNTVLKFTVKVSSGLYVGLFLLNIFKIIKIYRYQISFNIINCSFFILAHQK